MESTPDIPINDSLLGANARLPEAELPRGISASQAICATIATMIRSGRPATQSEFLGNDRMKEIFNSLDLTSLKSSLGPMHISHFSEYIAEVPSKVMTTPCSLIIDSEDWSYHLDVVAAGSFDNATQEELIVVMRDRSKRGYYDATQLLLLKLGNGATIVAREVPLLVFK